MPGRFIFLLLLFFQSFMVKNLIAQFAPAVGFSGSTAIHGDSSVFIAWATACEVIRGPVRIDEPLGEKASFGSPLEAIGQVQGNSVNVVSLGDGGMATLTFDLPISDGEGWDFAVFENALNDSFLELAFVEVSSDGESFTRFPAVSLTDPAVQVATFGAVECVKIHNLAGKYRQGYATPFDLAELSGTPGLDIQKITHVRVIDVIGCVSDVYASLDAEGNIINDPWPTPFNTGGFDLDGIGVIHSSGTGFEPCESIFKVFPNPFSDCVRIEFFNQENYQVSVFGLDGTLVFTENATSQIVIDLNHLPSGCYVLRMVSSSQIYSVKLFKIK